MEPGSSRQEQLIPEDAISPSLTQAETQCPSSANTCTFHHPFFWAAPARRENLVSSLLLNSFWAQIGCVWHFKEVSGFFFEFQPCLLWLGRISFQEAWCHIAQRQGPNSLKTTEFIYFWKNPFASQFSDRLAGWEEVWKASISQHPSSTPLPGGWWFAAHSLAPVQWAAWSLPFP